MSISRMACSRVSRSSVREAGNPNTPLMTLLCVRTCRPAITFSSTDNSPNSRMFWKVRAMPRSAMRYGCNRVISRPSKKSCPRFGAINPVMMLNSVVLPAPFGPIRPKISPR
jgi:hypothetical protein